MERTQKKKERKANFYQKPASTKVKIAMENPTVKKKEEKKKPSREPKQTVLL